MRAFGIIGHSDFRTIGLSDNKESRGKEGALLACSLRWLSDFRKVGLSDNRTNRQISGEIRPRVGCRGKGGTERGARAQSVKRSLSCYSTLNAPSSLSQLAAAHRSNCAFFLRDRIRWASDMRIIQISAWQISTAKKPHAFTRKAVS